MKMEPIFSVMLVVGIFWSNWSSINVKRETIYLKSMLKFSTIEKHYRINFVFITILTWMPFLLMSIYAFVELDKSGVSISSLCLTIGIGLSHTVQRMKIYLYLHILDKFLQAMKIQITKPCRTKPYDIVHQYELLLEMAFLFAKIKQTVVIALIFNEFLDVVTITRAIQTILISEFSMEMLRMKILEFFWCFHHLPGFYWSMYIGEKIEEQV